MAQRRGRGWWLGLGLILAGLSRATAQAEVREFIVRIDNKKAGSFSMNITPQPDGSTVMVGQVAVQVSYLIYTYKYSLHATETWKDGRLMSLVSTCNDDGKQFSVNAKADGEALRVQANGKEQRTRPDTWTTTYWHAPDARFRNQAIPLIDADTGKELAARLQYIGPRQISVAGQMQTCTCYRVTGGVQAELWFDDKDRLVREEAMEDGHRTVLELDRIRR
jgi:hypothetical protein